MVDFLKGTVIYFLPLDFGSKRIEFFKKQIKKFGGNVTDEGAKATHIIVEDSIGYDRMRYSAAMRSCGLKRNHFDLNKKRSPKHLRVSWLSKCLGSKHLVETSPYEIDWIGRENEDQGEGTKEKSCRENVDSLGKKTKVSYEDFVCSLPSTSLQSNQSTFQSNQVVIAELEKLANAYAVQNDKWRTHAYQKAINAVRQCQKKINTYQEALNIPGIGEKMALKIIEIIECGRLAKVDEIVDDKTRILESFCKVWGAGPSTAEHWYTLGCRCLEDVKEKGKPTRQQQIGLKYYEDLLERIPQDEVEEIFTIIRGETNRINVSVELKLVGSYRREKSSCGDVDIMIVNRGLKSSREILIPLTRALTHKGYLTDDLVSLESSESDDHHKKYFGIFKLPGENKLHRRLDLFVVPECEEAAALIHYTGSALYNRNMKLWAAKKGMILTERGLYADTLRNVGEVISKGRLIPTATEEDVFRELELPFKVPKERDQ